MSSRWKATILFHYWCTRRRIGHVVKRKGKLILPPEFDEKKIVFFHVPKTAGKSLATAIYDKDINHFSYNQVAKQKDLDGFFTFSFVRNPWDRIVSTYEFLKGGGWGGLDQIFLSLFQAAIHRIPIPGQFVPAVSSIVRMFFFLISGHMLILKI